MLSLPRRMRAVTPDFSAASARRRLAVRSSRLAEPTSMTAAASPAQPMLSDATFRQASSSGAVTSIILSGTSPSSARPGPYGVPWRRSSASVDTHRIGPPSAPARAASISANAAALAASVPLAGSTSCTAPLASPPSSRASSAASPKDKSPQRPLEAVGPRASIRRLSRAREEAESIMFTICSISADIKFLSRLPLA